MSEITSAFVAILGYLIGSIPSAYIIGKLAKGIDIRKVGDGNVGGANAFREVGAIAGLTVIIADILKGVVTILIAQALDLNQTAVFVAGFACVIGHIYPVFLGFKGGRGEATTGGILLVLIPVPALILLGIGLIAVITTRNTMLLGAIVFAPAWLGALLTGGSVGLIIYVILLPALVGVEHYLTTRHLSPEIRRRGRYLRQ